MRKLISKISGGEYEVVDAQTRVEKFFDSIDRKDVKRYVKYWEGITPQDEEEIFKRWLFAYMSIHTTWENNVVGYKAIREWQEWYKDSDILKKKIIDSRVGLHNNRTTYISKFAKQFFGKPIEYLRQATETWQEWRNRLVKENLGIGIAKVSFALEMCHPTDCKVVCVDTHIFQMYGYDQSKNSNKYEEIESHWLSMCKKYDVPSAIARAIYWDKKQGQTDTRYWSYVFED